MHKRPVFFANGQSVTAALRGVLFEISVPARLMGFAVGAVLIVTVGPFGTFDLPFPKRAGYWSSWLACVWITTTVCFAVSHRVAAQRITKNWVVSVLSLGMSVPLAAVLGLSLATLFFTSLEPDFDMYLAEAKFLSPIVFCITGLLHLTAPAPRRVVSVGDAFFARLPSNIGRDLVSVSSADHYLRVRTTGGETLVHGSLTEATRQLEGVAGGQIHRSHWVAYAQIERRTWSGQRLELVLSTGDVLPVSRTYRSDLLKNLRDT